MSNPLEPVRLVVVTGLMLLVWAGPGRAQSPPTASAAEDAEEARERRNMERFLLLLEKSPRRGTALDRVYGYHVERGTLDGLIRSYEDRVSKTPTDGVGWLLLGLFESQRGRDAAAVNALRRAEESRRDDPLPPYYLGQALVLVGQPEDAASAFERALARKPRRSDLLEIFQALGRVYQRAQKTKDAMDVWSRLEALFPDDPRVREQIAAALADEGQPELALPRYEALARSVKDPFRQAQLAATAADLELRLGKTEKALRDFESLLGRLRPESWLYREVRRKIDEVFLRNDDQAGLTTYYEAWTKKNPEDVEALVRLARSLAVQGKMVEAHRTFQQAIKLAPSRRELRLALIGQLVQDQRFADAAAQYEEMDKSEPNNPDTLRDWGGVLLRDKSKPEAARKAAAAAVWRRLIEARPKDAVTAAQVADLFRQAEMTDEALSTYGKAVELAPGDAQYYEYLGEYLHALKRRDEALAVWTKIAAGPNRNPKNLVRLAEVLAGFGFLTEAIPPMTEAVTAEGDDFTLRLKLAEMLHKAERYADATVQIDAAERLAENDEERAAALEAQVKNDAAADKLAARIADLRKELDAAGAKAPAIRWARLARYLEADSKLPEAEAAIARAVEADARSVPAWTLAARIRESAGQLGDAAAALRRLAEIDRRNRTEYLTGVAKLEARLGRADEAIKAGRDVIAAAPGNPESYEFFADLCAQLGRNDEGLDALRRAVRINPNETKAVLSLAETLAGLFRTEEAVEMYWRAFEKSPDLDAKLGVIARLTDLYLQRNQFDRLLGRLQREQGESPSAQQQRELAICTAQAYASSGDLGSARSELERLLATNARDTQLLQQLSKLAEEEGDLESAAKYQSQLVELAPTEEGKLRLAQLYVRFGDIAEAQALWSKMASGQNETHRVFQALDSLLGNDKSAAAFEIADALVRKDPHDWQALYRQAVALAQLHKPEEAARQFRTLLALRVDDDERSAIAKARFRDPALQSSGARASRLAQLQQAPFEQRLYAVSSIRAATGLEVRNYVTASRTAASSWAPSDFGQARMAAMGWLLALAQRDGTDAYEKAIASFRTAASGAGATQDRARALWDWYYVCALRNDYNATHEAARDLSRAAPTDPGALWGYLTSLSTRQFATGPRYYVAPGTETKDGTPPLPADEIDHMLACVRALRQRRPELLQGQVITGVSVELKRAKRTADDDTLYAEQNASAEQPPTIAAALSLAGPRGDVDAVIRLFDRWERLKPGTSSTGMAMGGSYFAGTATAMAQAMGVRGQAKGYDDVVRLLDHYLATVRRRHDRQPLSGRTPRSAGASSSGARSYYSIYVGTKPRNVQLSFPLPNEYFDTGAITLLRNAYEVYKQGDVVSDLTAHFRAQVDAAPTPADAVYPRLALSYLAWWEDDKDAALAEFTRVADASRAESDLRMILAELLEQRGEPAEALAVTDQVKPLDNATTQRREEQALRLAVLTGDLDRARLAAERLFGLRLDTETQIRLAGQMHQLGMHELAESVLARARRRAGGKATALVGLMLQYQRQDKIDVAVQVALQILRSTSGFRVSNPNVSNPDDPEGARTSAIQVLARSGRIKAMIARVEEQVRQTPSAIQLRQALADYYKADNQRDKARDQLEQIAALRPDDAAFRYQIASQLVSDGRAADALPHYKAAITKDPRLLARSFYNVENAYRQANKMDQLAELIETIDIRALGQSYYVSNLMSYLQNDPRTKDKVMPLFRKAWDAFPSQRAELLSTIRRDAFWQSPESYEYAHQVIVGENASSAPYVQWNVVGSISSYGAEGRINSTLTQILDLAASLGKLESLGDEVASNLKTTPGWMAGKAILALVDCRRGRFDEGMRLVDELLDHRGDQSIPTDAFWVIGSELENYDATRQLAIRVYDASLADRNNMSSMGFNYSPARRLVAIYDREGRKDDVRQTLLKFSKPSDESAGYPDEYLEQQRLQTLATSGQQLAALGFAVDAIPLLTEAVAVGDRLTPGGPMYFGNLDALKTQARERLDQAVRGLDAEQLASTVAQLIDPASDAHPRGEKESGRSVPRDQAVDLVLLVHPPDLAKAAVKSIFAEAVVASAKLPGRIDQAAEQLARQRSRHPDDLSIAIADALVALAGGDEVKAREALGTLKALTDRLTLEALPREARANARQRLEAARQMPLWIVARACGDGPLGREFGAPLEARALEAAARQSDQRWLLAMLREQGQTALNRGDTAGADAAWGRMLDLILAREAATRRSSQPSVAPQAPAPAAKAAVRRTSAAAEPKAKAKIVPAPRSASAPRRENVPILTIERFEQAAAVSKLAAENGRFALSLRAAREALAGGPPVPMPTTPSNRVVIRSRTGDTEPLDAVTPRVIARLVDLEGAWQRHRAPAKPVYEALRDIAMPAGRPSELFLYAQPISATTLMRPRSLGAMLATWAVRAGKLDELRGRVEGLRAQPLAALPSAVLLAQLELAGGDDARTSKALDGVAERLKSNVLRSSAELGCHVALPAMARPATANASLSLLDLCLKPLQTPTVIEPAASLVMVMARRQFELGDTDGGRKRLNEYTELNDRNGTRYAGDYPLFLRKRVLQRVAAELARFGRWTEVLDTLGRFADIPSSTSQPDPPIAYELGLLIRHLDTQPAANRYETLKTWTLPAANRQAVRILASLGVPEPPPSVFTTSAQKDAAATGSALVGTASALVAAAREAGALDELAAAAAAAADKKLQNAESLLVLVEVARGKVDAIRPRVQSRLDALAKEVAGPVDPANSSAPRAVATRVAFPWNDCLVARAAMTSDDPALLTLGLQLAEALVESAKKARNYAVMSHLNFEIAAARWNLNRAKSAPRHGGVTLAHWHPADIQNNVMLRDDSADPYWVAHDGVIAHVSGPGQDFLLFDRPLTGRYEVTFDTTAEAFAQGGFCHNGLVFDLFTPQVGAQLFPVGGSEQIRRPLELFRADTLNRVTIQVSPERVRYLANGHLYFEDDDPSPTSPWLGLYTVRERRAAWRNLSIRGNPTVPSEVRLSHDDRLEGWVASFYNESQPARRTTTASDEYGNTTRVLSGAPQRRAQPRPDINFDDFDWAASDGEIRGRRLVNATPRAFYALSGDALDTSAAVQSRLFYFRPLRDGDSISYEFYYEPDQVMVHPALGRVAFLVETDGVKLHWMTSPAGEMSGLTADNSVAAPGGGDRVKLPQLKAGEWNSATLALESDTVTITINGEPVYRQAIESPRTRQFGFYHDKDRTAARIRNVVLRGRWPASFAENSGASLATLAAPSPLSDTDRRALHSVIGERILGSGADEVLARTAALEPLQRYDELARWVLPTPDHPVFRLHGSFTPSNAVTGPTERKSAAKEMGTPRRVFEGGNVRAPALELVDAAKAAGKLDDLVARIDRAEANDDASRRAQLALGVVIAIARDDDAAAGRCLEALKPLLDAMPLEPHEWTRWPELVATVRSVDRPALRAQALALLATMDAQVRKRATTQTWDMQVKHVRARATLLAERGGDADPLANAPVIARWAGATQTRAASRGEGAPASAWTFRDRTFTHHPGHLIDMLYLDVPFRGNFQLDCELSGFNWTEMRVCYGGIMIGPKAGLKQVARHQLDHYLPEIAIVPPLEPIRGGWYAYRLVVKNGSMTSYVNGRQIYQSALPTEGDPWLALWCDGRAAGGARNLTITGAPTVPDRLNLSALPDLTGWRADEYDERIGGDQAAWLKRGDELVGRRGNPAEALRGGNVLLSSASSQASLRDPMFGSKRESVLRYHRPLFEDGEISYEFFFEPDRAMVHPAVGRLALMLEPDGVKRHWLTDAQYERTGLAADNVAVEPECRRGPATLPLKAKAWNRVTLALAGDTITLRVNGELIYARALEPTNLRNFGLFHFADETEVRVRNVTYRGDWPRTLPGELVKSSAP